ncbi:MAG: ATP-grasp domain-containing protein [Hyphomicrobium sp.]|uniref:ATP-grasp domain-containing protein n=1 Tax=Hyphomicrobium sp. TaxID=82 RepID=UPI00356169BC
MNWYTRSKDFKFTLTDEVYYKDTWKKHIPVGSVEFVSEFLKLYHNIAVKPINVPESLFDFANRKIMNGTEKHIGVEKFIKSNDKIKSITGIHNIPTSNGLQNIAPVGNYQISDVIEIASEWRCFVFKGELVGLQNYSGDFCLFPDKNTILKMISAFKNPPIAYTLDIGVNNGITFVIEVHDFFSCGLYGFAEHKIYLSMLSEWFWEFIKKNRVN